MATSQPTMSSPVATIHRRSGLAWMLWISVTILCVTLASLVAWQLHSLDPRAKVSIQQVLSFIATLETALIVSTGQWLVLRHYKVNAHWWIPASVAASIGVAVIIGPLVISLAAGGGVIPPITSDGGLALGMLSSATSGIVVGTAQAFVLRGRGGNMAWAWILASTLGGALAAAVTHALSVPLIDATFLPGFPIAGLIASLAAVGGFIASACQAPVLVRLVRKGPVREPTSTLMIRSGLPGGSGAGPA